MELIAVTAMITVFLLVTAVFSGVGRRMDNKAARLAEVSGAQLREAGEAPKPERKWRQMLQRRELARKPGKEKQPPKRNRKLTEAEKLLDAAGSSMTGSQFTALKILVGVILGCLTGIVCSLLKLESGLAPLCALGAGIAGSLLPIRVLRMKVERKKEIYRGALPDVMDLLVVSVEAGLGFDAALMRLYEKDKSPLMEELIRGQTDIRHGMSKKESYTNVSRRCGVKEVTSFLNALIQAEQMGISIKTVLKTQADTLREERRQRAEEKALKAPITMMIPLVMFVFPVIFVVLLGPAVMRLMEALA